MIHCYNCDSTKVKSFDYQPLYHPTTNEMETCDYQYDNEIYIEFECTDCGDTFTKVFDLIPQKD